FRILRVLRLISRNESLRVGVKALLYALPNIGNVTVIMLFFFLIFGIICVSYFKGKFFICS
ncbi:MAG: ion transporter, partial [bacterium]